MAIADCLIENLDRVIGGAAARRRDMRDETGKAHAAHIDAKSPRIVITQHLAGDFGDAVYRRRPLHCILRRSVARIASGIYIMSSIVSGRRKQV